jgi:DNA-binding response OmpR family regulator
MARIAVVEDERLLVTMLELNLRRNGHEVLCFERAEDLLDFLAAQTCDVILLDIMLPGMSGSDALEELRRRGYDMPILMLTARREVELKVETLTAGADDYVTKPFDMNELLARIAARVRQRNATREDG